MAKNEMLAARRTVHILDYRDLEFSFGFNPLQVADDLYIDATVERAVDAVATAATGDGAGGQHLVIETLTDIFTALAYARLTLVEAKYLLSPQYPAEREAITSTIKNPEVRSNWERHNFMAIRSPHKYLEKFDPANRRIQRLIGVDLLRPIIGQSQNVLDLKQAMDDGDIILVDLSLEGGHPPPEGANLLGRLLVSSFVAAAFQRAARTSKPYNLYIDEVHKYLTYNISTILDECPKFGLHLTFAHQHLSQLAKADDKGLLLAGVMASAQNKICFRLGSPEDADTMQRRIFAGHYNFELPKRSLDKHVVVGHEIVNMQTFSEGTTEATTVSEAEAQAQSYMESHGLAESSSTSISESDSSSVAHSLAKSHGTSHSENSSHGSHHSSGASANSGSSHASIANAGTSEGMATNVNFGGGMTVDQDGNPVAMTDNMGGGSSLSVNNTHASGAVDGHSHGAGHSHASGGSSNHGISRGHNESTTEGITRAETHSRGLTETSGSTESYSVGQGTTYSQGTSRGRMQGTNQAHGISQALKPILQVQHTAVYSLPELERKFSDGILTLPKRTAYATISGVGMTKITTLDTPDVIVSLSRRTRVLHELKQKSSIHKPRADANREIEERFARFMDREAPSMIEHDPMNPTTLYQPDQEKNRPPEDPMNPD